MDAVVAAVLSELSGRIVTSPTAGSCKANVATRLRGIVRFLRQYASLGLVYIVPTILMGHLQSDKWLH